MTDAIVNPWIFYLMSVCGGLRWLTFVVSIIGWGVIIFLALAVTAEFWVDGEVHDTKYLLKLIKSAVLPMIIVTLLAIFIPSETTLMRMTVASYVTPESVGNAYQIVLDVTNDLLGIVNK